ncbi:MAG: aminotransferase class III-fold pyridoxal phosphate-dependent enzyme [Gammaproteobacteria bacterium]|jgi:beta-alanine--pyruvate transaminase|nr:aminotransferase class III-fold pyridoxal phosphate-dependent enzyme [Gammaproteobacteria bacterium]MBT4491805.1 aminotransferase class III-fold pyridoxal phosphate-dependent enzyme [Gammaproteobacteria bacterium]MBT7370214.1 aminotransferase class III-fold pyridoxal phosphate-dependent enzyme [Gammaproteobacteria bacterium]
MNEEMITGSQLVREELESHWLPFTDNKTFKDDPRLVVKGEGMFLWNQHGDRLLDGCSGLFTCAAGHCREEITRAVSEQLQQLDYMTSFLRSHPRSFEAANKLTAILPEPINHVFFCNSGSEAVDTAIKIAQQYHACRGEGHRNIFVSRHRAYHGVNIGGTSLSGLAKNRQGFNGVMPGVVHMRSTWDEEQRFSIGQPLHRGRELADDLYHFVQTYGANNIAACFIEPVAGSTGCLVPPVGYLERIREICDEYGILLVMDEVITGFGRTGAPFAADAFGVNPDIVTLAKALTNGAQPMGAVAVRDEIYETVVDAYPDGVVELAHGYTYSAHPAACAAAIATLDIYEKESLFERAGEMSEYFLNSIFALQNLGTVTDIRGLGLFAGIDVEPEGAAGAKGNLLQKRLFDAGLHIKTTGDSVLIAPPLIVEKEQIDEMCEILKQELNRL